MASSAHHRRWIRQEAAMAAITFNAARQKDQAHQRKAADATSSSKAAS
jgi:hypothetical protein